ncbi:MAG: transposase [Clostridiales bacterium]|nr:transposase [Clostridiales bacterium]
MKENLPVRKRIRLQDYDYSEENMYFITICVKDRVEILGKIIEDNIKLTKEGNVVKQNINKIGRIYKNVIIDEYVIMPNHIHILLLINYKSSVTISKIIKHFKTNITREIEYSIWQKSFYEHIIRNEKEYLKIKEYIKYNVINWEKDKYF